MIRKLTPETDFLRGGQCADSNKPLWNNNFFELKALEFLKSLVCLKQTLPKELSCQKCPPQEQLSSSLLGEWEKSALHPNRHCHQTIVISHLFSYGPICLSSDLFFHKCPFPHSLWSHFFLPEVPLYPSSSSVKIVYKPQILTASLSRIFCELSCIST